MPDARPPLVRWPDATPLRFDCGRPDRFWRGNALLLGACRPGPLEATELHLLQSGITRFLGLFRDSRPFRSRSAQEYNRLTIAEHDGVRDFRPCISSRRRARTHPSGGIAAPASRPPRCATGSSCSGTAGGWAGGG